MPSVSIAIRPEIFDRFSDLNFKPSQAIAEFIDNAIQSYLDFKNNSMFYHEGYKLTIDINIDWEESEDYRTYAKSIVIKDNAAGMAISKYEQAFETGHRPAFNEGLNEYGMGMKTAAYWLSQQWTIISKSFSESVERTLTFDIGDIVKNHKTSLEFQEKEVSGNQSYTIIRLENLHKKNNFTKRMLGKIKDELASIYRAFLRRGEIQINVNNEALIFDDPEILVAPYYEKPSGPNIEWKVQISKNMFGKEINGFIGILSEMSEKQSGLVIMRRGRVIVGESSEHLYHPESLFGTYRNGFIYKRLYGEIEIKGFSASFNKNGFSNMDELEEMLGILKKTLKVDNYSLIKQANELRDVEILWKFENGWPDNKTKCKPGAKLTPPATPFKENYTFKGWSPTPKDVATKNTTYTAQWAPVEDESLVPKFSVRWKFENGEQDVLETYKKNAILKVPTPQQRPGYVFEGWNPAPQFSVTSDVEYIAQWRENINPAPIMEVSVRWFFNNGQDEKSFIYKKGEKVEIPDSPTRPGYKFKGWFPNIQLTATKDISYNAQWDVLQPISANNVIESRSFPFEDKTVRMDLVKSDDKDVLLTLDMERYRTEGVVVGILNPNKLPISDKSLSNSDVKKLLLSLAVGMFEAQMNDEDTCEGLMKHIK